MGFFAVDDVLIRVVEVVIADRACTRVVTLDERHAPGSEFGQQRLEIGHQAFCFSLQEMQTRVQGIASSRASAMSSPQSRQTPNVPSSMRRRASSMAWRIFASVCFSLSWICTSLLPLA